MNEIGLAQVGQLEASDLALITAVWELCGDKKFHLLDFPGTDEQNH